MGANCSCEGSETVPQREAHEEHMVMLVPEERHGTYLPSMALHAASRGTGCMDAPVFTQVVPALEKERSSRTAAEEKVKERPADVGAKASDAEADQEFSTDKPCPLDEVSLQPEYSESSPGAISVSSSGRPVVPPLKLPRSRYPPVPPLKLPACPHPPVGSGSKYHVGGSKSHHQAGTKLPRLLQAKNGSRMEKQ
mmetsp:Transcript_92753/g.276658  ORF Transcript_92753/g.276658 Transcript_92753/m.276658 type:complete len:195 (+) Transcript_92753:70-654(+)